MGYSAWSDAAYASLSRGRTRATAAEIFRGDRSVDPLMSPRGLTVREARDSEHHPRSVPIIVAFDVTGSMGELPTRFAQEMLGHLMRRLVENAWVADPQVLFAAIGDAESDAGPLQVGQFESGLEMDMWLTRLWLEGGGGDLPESYTLAHWFAAHHTATDAWDKRGAKGLLFTLGDAPNKSLNRAQLTRVFGEPAPGPTSDAEVIAAAAQRWDLFHILVAKHGPPDDDLLAHWTQRVGDRLLVLDQVDAVCELIGAVIGLREGRLDRDQARRLLAEAGLGSEAVARALRAVG